MRHVKTILTILTFLFLVEGCIPDENDVGVVADNPNIKKSEKFYSPDKRCYVTIYENVFDSTEAKTHVVITFEKTPSKTGAGIYSVKGIHKDIKVSWADNSTLVIETKKEYLSRQKLDQVQSFDDRIKINYIEITTIQTLDSICTINEILNDKHEHFNDLFKSLIKTDSSFSQIVSTFRHHITDTIIKQKSKDIIIINFGDDFGVELHIKGLKKLKQIPFNNIKADKIQMVQYYHGPHIIKDDVIDETTSKH